MVCAPLCLSALGFSGLGISGLLLEPARGHAQDVHAQEAPDAGVVQVRTHVERPPEGSMRRGSLPVPAWAVWICGGLVVAGALGALGWRLRRSAR